jgi:hypothetical protein
MRRNTIIPAARSNLFEGKGKGRPGAGPVRANQNMEDTMVYHNVADILDDAQGVRTRLYQKVENLSAAQAGFKPAAEAWSVAQVLEHLGKVEQYLVKQFGQILAQAEAADNGKTMAGGFAPFSMDSYVESLRDQKFKSPESLVPEGGLPVSELLQRLRASRADLMALQPRFEAHDLSGIIRPHPAYGPINPYQGLAGVATHEGRHLRQIEAIMASPGFPAA